MAGFESAGRLASQQNKELLVFYESWLSPECSEMKLALDSAGVRSLLGDKIYCVLDESYEPNQRVVAQYGISRFPSLILIHRDGTYHQHQGAMGAGAIAQFIDASKPPGRRPRINPQIPRTVDYRWEADYERAFARAEQQNRSVFIFYKSVISADSNEMLASVLNRSDVAGLFDNSINCLLDWGYPPNRRLMVRYGVTNVPGIVIVNPDGTYHARQGRMTAAQIISFARGAIAQGRNAPTGR